MKYSFRYRQPNARAIKLSRTDDFLQLHFQALQTGPGLIQPGLHFEELALLSALIQDFLAHGQAPGNPETC